MTRISGKTKTLLSLAALPLLLAGCVSGPTGATEVKEYEGVGKTYIATVLAKDKEVDCIVIKDSGISSLECLWDVRRPASEATKDPNRETDLTYHVLDVNGTEAECIMMATTHGGYGNMDCNV